MRQKRTELEIFTFLKEHRSSVLFELNKHIKKQCAEHSVTLERYFAELFDYLIRKFNGETKGKDATTIINQLMIFTSENHIDFDTVMKINASFRYHLVKQLIIDSEEDEEPVLGIWLSLVSKIDILQELMFEYAVALHKKRVRETEAKYRNMVEEIKEGLIYVDYDFNVTFANKPLCEMLGRPKSEVVGKNLQELVPESVYESLQKYKKDYETTKTEIAVFELDTNSDDQGLNVEVTPSVIHEGGKAVGFQATVRSIVERKAMERKLKERYEKMQQAYLELGKVNRQMASLIDISAIISSDFDADEVFNFILSSIAILAEADTATLRKLNTRRNTLELVATYKMSYVWEKGKILQVKESVSGDAITSADAIKIDNLQNDHVHKYRRFLLSTNLKSIYAIPLQIAGKAIGTLTLYSMQEGKFDELDEDFISALVGQAAIALKMYT